MSLWERMFATNIFGPVALTKALLPSMRKAGRGRIVLVSSAGGVRGMPATAPYSAVKGALERWGEVDGGRGRPFGIGVTILVTGTYDTEIITDAGTTDSRDLDGPYAAPPRHHGQARAGHDEARRKITGQFRHRTRQGARGLGAIRPAPGRSRRANAVDR